MVPSGRTIAASPALTLVGLCARTTVASTNGAIPSISSSECPAGSRPIIETKGTPGANSGPGIRGQAAPTRWVAPPRSCTSSGRRASPRRPREARNCRRPSEATAWILTPSGSPPSTDQWPLSKRSASGEISSIDAATISCALSRSLRAVIATFSSTASLGRAVEAVSLTEPVGVLVHDLDVLRRDAELLRGDLGEPRLLCPGTAR